MNIEMDNDHTKVYMTEGVPLNSKLNTTKVILNPKPTKRTVIHLNPDKVGASDVIEINTNVAILHTKLKFFLILNFILSFFTIIFAFALGGYLWNELVVLRKDMDTMNQYILSNAQNKKTELAPTALLLQKPEMQHNMNAATMTRQWTDELNTDMYKSPQKDETLKTDDIVSYVLKKIQNNVNVTSSQTGWLVAHFDGAFTEAHLGTNKIIGPWMIDREVSRESGVNAFELSPKQDYVTVKESGLYIVYAHITYITQSPSSYFVWARQPGEGPRLVTSCFTGSDSTKRDLSKSQLSCTTNTVARLNAGETVNIAQRELNRTLWLKPGYSYFGFVKIST